MNGGGMSFMHWSFPLFRVFGITIRMHWMMAILIAVYMLRGAAGAHGFLLGLGFMAITMGILLLTIVLHEPHFQSIADPGPRLQVAARAPDGVIEAVELPGDRFVMGIQWHPELEQVSEDLQMAPFRLLVEAARRRAKR